MLLVPHLQEGGDGDGAVTTHSRGRATIPHHTAKVMILPRFGLDGMHSVFCGSCCMVGGIDSTGHLFQGQMPCKSLCVREHRKEVRQLVAMLVSPSSSDGSTVSLQTLQHL